MAAVGEALARALPPQTPSPGLRERVLTRATRSRCGMAIGNRVRQAACATDGSRPPRLSWPP